MPEGRLLVVDDERSMRELLALALEQEGYRVVQAESGEAALGFLETDRFDVVITDLRMRKVDGLAVLRAVRERAPDTLVVVITAYGTTETAVEAMKLGAYDYITKPFKLEEMRLVVAKAVERRRLQEENRALRRQLRRERSFDGFVGRSPVVLEVLALVDRAADSAATVVITGESGTGKELIARLIHAVSPRRAGPFVPVNCGAIAENLMESELFGHVRGAYTGAVSSARGVFGAADGGTLFLDEITELPAGVQVKLLRAIQEREVRPVGSPDAVRVDVRLLAASNRDLEAAVADGVLRSDLFYRLNVISIALPPLRARREDIPLLVNHFLARFAEGTGRPARSIAPEVLAVLERYDWPGNVRELENALERAVVFSYTDMGITLGALPDTVRGLRPAPLRQETALPDTGLDLEAVLASSERDYLRRALDQAGGVQSRAAELLGLSFRQFRYKLAKHGLRPKGD